METVKNLSLPCRVYVELTDGECYTGALIAFNQKFKSVELTELSDMESKQKLKGVQTFFESEIEKIEPLDATPSGSSKSSESLTEPEQKKSRHDDRKSLQPRQSESRKCELKLDRVDSGHGPITTTIDDAEMKHIDERIRSAVLIVQCDVSYHQALEDLRRQEIVGLNIEGSKLGRLRYGSLLAFSTTDKIYLFDLKSFGRIFSDMKKILESNKPRKIVHNSCLIVDHLKRQYKCQLNGIQDTLVTHILIKKQKEVITIGDCLSEYFNIRIQPKHEPNWNKRPLSDRRKSIAATNVAYLIKLFFHMSVDIYCRPLQQMTIEYSQTYSQNDDTVEVCDQITNRRNPGLKFIDTNANDFANTLLDVPENV